MVYGDILEELKSKGRYGDTELAHVTPGEAMLLKALGGSGTINPETGLKEYFRPGNRGQQTRLAAEQGFWNFPGMRGYGTLRDVDDWGDYTE